MGRPGHATSRLTVLIAFLALIASACTYSVDLTPTANQARSSFVYAADGSTLARLHAEQDREPVSLDQVDPVLVDAIIAIEDRRFRRHAGVDVRGIARAALENIESGQVEQGGSTITQQYVRNALLDEDDRSLGRKVKEASLAYQVEKRLEKEEILERYLNTVYFGIGAYGVEAAAKRFFDTSASDLTVAQAALLAGMIRSPEHTDPVKLPERAEARRDTVLDEMVRAGTISTAQAREARREPIEVSPPEEGHAAGHFVEAVKRSILANEDLAPTRADRRDLLFTGGLRIHTTLDPATQAAAEASVAETLEDRDAPVGALITLEPETGAVRALWGGHQFFGDAEKAKFDFATQGRRQAGSAFKPFALAAALDSGVGPRQPYPAPSQIELEMPEGQPDWEVSNYGGGGYGTVSLARATTSSINTVYAQLILDLGPERVTDMAKRLGIRADLRPVPAAVLGANEVSPLGMATAYATLANGGMRVDPGVIERIETADGELLWERSVEPERVLDESVALNVTEVLESVVRSGTGRAALLPDQPAAGKTGTAQEWRDAWFVGFTPYLSTAVWVGHPDQPTPMRPPLTPRRITGGSWPAQIWHEFMTTAHADRERADFGDAPPFEATVLLATDTRSTCRRADNSDLEVRETLDGDDDAEPCDTVTTSPPASTTTTSSTTTTTEPPTTTTEPPTTTTEPPTTTTESSTTTTSSSTTTSSTTTSSSTTSSSTTSSTTTSSTTSTTTADDGD